MKEMVYSGLSHETNAEILDEGTINGYDYMIVSYCSHPCAYVRLYNSHPFYGLGYDDIPVDCHGGLTYSNEPYSGSNTPIGEKPGYWIGWDYAHAGDYTALPDCIKRLPLLTRGGGVQWTTEQIHEEVVNVIEQLKTAQDEVLSRNPADINHVDEFFTDIITGETKKVCCLGMTRDELIADILKSFKPATKEQKKHLYKTLLSYRDHVDSEESRVLLNKLIGDRRIIDKACIITDGSFARFRIFCWMDWEDKVRVWFDSNLHQPGDAKVQKLCENKQVKKALNYIVSKYDMIPFHDISIGDMRFSRDMNDAYDSAWDYDD